MVFRTVRTYTESAQDRLRYQEPIDGLPSFTRMRKQLVTRLGLHNAYHVDVVISGGNPLLTSLLAMRLAKGGVSVVVDVRADGSDGFLYDALLSYTFRAALDNIAGVTSTGDTPREWLRSFFNHLAAQYASLVIQDQEIGIVDIGLALTPFNRCDGQNVYSLQANDFSRLSGNGRGETAADVFKCCWQLFNHFEPIGRRELGGIGRYYLTSRKAVWTTAGFSDDRFGDVKLGVAPVDLDVIPAGQAALNAIMTVPTLAETILCEVAR